MNNLVNIPDGTKTTFEHVDSNGNRHKIVGSISEDTYGRYFDNGKEFFIIIKLVKVNADEDWS